MSRFTEAELVYGQGTQNVYEDATFLVYGSLSMLSLYYQINKKDSPITEATFFNPKVTISEAAKLEYIMLFLNGVIDKLVPLLTDGSEQTIVNTLFILYTLSKNRKNSISTVLWNLSVVDRETSEIATSLAKVHNKK
eukprot:Phypoly_transcript_16278.p1 GENE.Phypoly_transcript_16278~~Phypoly_transcript_16278.p1  ORF type:complete len:137 (+),score=19.44 Phypoly_transcript_16278:412-822(+)